VLAKVPESKDKDFGYNAETDVYENLVISGVIAPTKVTRTALENAASIARAAAHHRVRGGGAEEEKRRPRVGLRAVVWAECTSRRRKRTLEEPEVSMMLTVVSLSWTVDSGLKASYSDTWPSLLGTLTLLFSS
jgi:hypothetical protein